MKKFFRLTAVLLVLAMAFSFLTIASAEAPRKLTVGVAVNTSDYKTAIVSIEKWAKERGVELEVIEENTQTYASSYVLASQTKNPRFDIVMFWDFYLDQLYTMLTPLEGSYDPAIDFSAIDNGDILRAGYGEYQGHPYNVPYGLDSYVMYYRTDLFEQAGIEKVPETWDELIEVAQKLTVDLDGNGNFEDAAAIYSRIERE